MKDRGSLANVLWGDRSPRWLLPLVSVALLFLMLGAPTLWTHEGRWALICREMNRSGDYFHPRLLSEDYFDKPLLSYWLMIFVGRIIGGLGEVALRIPGVLAGLLTIACTVRLGNRIGTRETGRIAGWMLASTFFFVSWSRLACSDMLNVAAVVGAAWWYFERRDRPAWTTWAGFFTILGIGSLMKGPVGAALAIVAVMPDLLASGRWRLHLKPELFLGMIPGVLVFVLPYVLAATFGPPENGARGLGAVIHENLVRYFDPFDHPDPFYTYAQYLPAYGLPWTFFLPFVFWEAARKWKTMRSESRWPILAACSIFVFLTLGAGRRNYYILPILPFLMLSAAGWVVSSGRAARRVTAASWTAAASGALILLYFGAAIPFATTRGGARAMAVEVRQAAGGGTAWKSWDLDLYGVKPQLAYYLETFDPPRRLRESELDSLPGQIHEHPCTIVVTQERHLKEVEARVGPARIVRERSMLPGSWGDFRFDGDAMVALIPFAAPTHVANR